MYLQLRLVSTAMGGTVTQQEESEIFSCVIVESIVLEGDDLMDNLKEVTSYGINILLNGLCPSKFS
jgi:ligand-binding sensor protein